MADQQLPLIPTVPSYRVATQLGEAVYLFDLRWNERDSAWYMDILEDDETKIRVGIKIVLGTILGGRVRASTFPAGIFFAADLTGSGEDAGLDDLGTRVVVYFTPDEDL